MDLRSEKGGGGKHTYPAAVSTDEEVIAHLLVDAVANHLVGVRLGLGQKSRHLASVGIVSYTLSDQTRSMRQVPTGL